MFCPECGEVTGPGPLDLRHSVQRGPHGLDMRCSVLGRIGAALLGLTGWSASTAGRSVSEPSVPLR